MCGVATKVVDLRWIDATMIHEVLTHMQMIPPYSHLKGCHRLFGTRIGICSVRFHQQLDSIQTSVPSRVVQGGATSRWSHGTGIHVKVGSRLLMREPIVVVGAVAGRRAVTVRILCLGGGTAV